MLRGTTVLPRHRGTIFLVQSRFAETRFAETRFAETLTLTLTLNPNFGESGFGETGRHHFSTVPLRRLYATI